MPFTSLPLPALFMYFRRMIPLPVNAHRETANLAVLLVPRALLVILRHVAPVLVYTNLTAALATIDFIPLGHNTSV